MELWIRSQNKNVLTTCNYFDVNDEGEIIIYDGCPIAKYKTKERALEVLDEIQRRLTLPNYETTNNKYSQYDKLVESRTSKESSTYVYEMPEE